jgi:hypothetical protein
VQVARLVDRWPLELFQRRQNRPALRVAKDDDETCSVPLRRELDAPDLRRRDDVAGNANDEQVAESLIEHDFGRDA